MKHTALILAAACTLALAACTKPADKPADAAADPAAATATSTPAETAPTDVAAPTATSVPAETAPAAVAAADSVGIPECDDYLSKVNTCLADKVPADQRAMFQTGLDSSRTAWKQAAANPASKAALASTCKTALDQMKTALGAYGCAL
ncbi:hypothetical protein [Lysobacter sp. cf310]|uniref:hypothetical protein n=1 Tax=Lysobacter sp. cf310 TaxID=1761790 RepID=UPI0008EDCBB9|nr:hypothetical protein [Lysobacter sp. cf310]SFK78507.1 Meckel syndrome type 1 protein [Lysobacter sp. cf310]